MSVSMILGFYLRLACAKVVLRSVLETVQTGNLNGKQMRRSDMIRLTENNQRRKRGALANLHPWIPTRN